ncbi:MAG: hypothetical protein ABSB57_02025, partial [Dehalococcoidia bacterium]
MATSLGSAVLELNCDPSKLKAGMQAAESNVQGSLKNMGTASSGLSNKLTTLALAAGSAVAVFLSYKTLESALSATQDLAQGITKLGRETGLTAEESSKLIFAFQHYGLDINDASVSLGILAKKLKGVQDEETGVTTGGKSTAQILADIGVKSLTTTGQLAPMGVIMPQIADVFATMPDGVEKTGLAMELFGRSGKNMIPVLNLGSEGLKALGIDAERLGVVMDQKAVTAAKNLTFAQRDLHEAMKGLEITVAEAAIPALTALATGATNALVAVRPLVTEGLQEAGDWLTVHKEEFISFGNNLLDMGEKVGKGFVDILPGAIGVGQQLGTLATNILPPLIDVVSRVASLLADNPALIYAMIAAWGSFKVGILVQGLASLAAGFFSLAAAEGVATAATVTLESALITTGIGAIIVGLGVAAYEVWQNWDAVWPRLAELVDTWYNNVRGPLNAGISLLDALGASIGKLPELNLVPEKTLTLQEAYNQKLKESGIVIESTGERAARLAQNVDIARQAFLEADRNVGKFNATAENAKNAAAAVVPPVLDLGFGLGDTGAAASGAAKALDDAAKAADDFHKKALEA